MSSLLSASSSPPSTTTSQQPPSPTPYHTEHNQRELRLQNSSPATPASNSKSSRAIDSPSASPSTPSTPPRLGPLILQAPQPSDILFFNENRFDPSSMMMMGAKGSQPVTANTPNTPTSSLSTPMPRPIVKKSASSTNMSISSGSGKRVRFPDDESIKDFSEAPKRGWHPGKHPTNDLLDAYIRACDKHKCKPLARLTQQLKALQDLDCANGEKVNVLNLKSERLDSRQIESLEEVFKRLSFKTIDLEAAIFEDDTAGSTLFEILDYYDTCERLIIANSKGMGIYGWQELSKYCRKTVSLENLDLRGQTYSEFIYFTYLARSFRLTQSVRVLHLEASNLNTRLLIMLAAAMRDNDHIRELYLGENKLTAATDGPMLASIVKEARALELFDLRSNTSLGDLGLSYICSALSTDGVRLKHLIMANCGLTQAGVPYLCKALIHNRSLVSLNIGHNSLTNESIFELKQALLVNRQLESLCLQKSKLGDEGCVALAEYVAETRTLKRLDLRENDIRLGGLMALASSLKFNSTLELVEVDREPKREQSIRDSLETSKRLLADINEFCVRNKRNQAERERIRDEQQKLDETIQMEDDASKSALEESPMENDPIPEHSPDSTTNMNQEPDEDAIDIIAKDDELLKKILHRTFSPQPNLHSPMAADLPDSYFAQFVIHDLNESAEYQLVERDNGPARVETHPDVVSVMEHLLDSVERSLAPNNDEIVDSDSDIEVLSPNSPPISTAVTQPDFHTALPTPEFTPVLTSTRPRRASKGFEIESTPIKSADVPSHTRNGGDSSESPPFFDSNLTSSQLSEELSKEIGLFN